MGHYYADTVTVSTDWCYDRGNKVEFIQSETRWVAAVEAAYKSILVLRNEVALVTRHNAVVHTVTSISAVYRYAPVVTIHGDRCCLHVIKVVYIQNKTGCTAVAHEASCSYNMMFMNVGNVGT